MKREFCISSYGVADQGHWLGTNSQQYKKIIHKKEKAHFYVLQLLSPVKRSFVSVVIILQIKDTG